MSTDTIKEDEQICLCGHPLSEHDYGCECSHMTFEHDGDFMCTCQWFVPSSGPLTEKSLDQDVTKH